MTKSNDQKPTDTAATFRFDTTLLRKVKFIALKECKTQTAIIEELLVEFLDKYEKKHGEIDF